MPPIPDLAAPTTDEFAEDAHFCLSGYPHFTLGGHDGRQMIETRD